MKTFATLLASAALLAPLGAFAQYYSGNSGMLSGQVYGYSYPMNYYQPVMYSYYYPYPQVNVVSGVYQPQSYGYGMMQQRQQQSSSYYPYQSYSYQPHSYGTYGMYASSYAPPMSAGPQQGYPTGDYVWGNAICNYPGYGRAYCGSDPRQPVYDPWTGTWY